MKKSFFISISVMLFLIILCSCANAQVGNDTENTQPTENTQATEVATQEVTQPPTEEVATEPPTDPVKKNSNTYDIITSFEYLSDNKIQELSYQNNSYDDVLTCYIKYDNSNQTMHYLVDIKGAKLYWGTSPNRWYATEDYPCKKDLSVQEITKIINAIKSANTQSWPKNSQKESCKKVNTIRLEYKNGAVEEHNTSCKGCGSIQNYQSIVDTICQIANSAPCSNCGNVHTVCNRCGNIHAVCSVHNGCGCGCNCNQHYHYYYHHHHHYQYTVCYQYTYC